MIAIQYPSNEDHVAPDALYRILCDDADATSVLECRLVYQGTVFVRSAEEQGNQDNDQRETERAQGYDAPAKACGRLDLKVVHEVLHEGASTWGPIE